ncbi:MAG: hypothetical protein ACKVOQ_23610 [Cyclobacteriaceae bacterium]
MPWQIILMTKVVYKNHFYGLPIIVQRRCGLAVRGATATGLSVPSPRPITQANPSLWAFHFYP